MLEAWSECAWNPEEATVNDQPTIRLPDDPAPTNNSTEETLVVDPRGQLTPSQLVERKLVALLRTTPLPLSQILSDRYTGR
jgi:hypothetical protein